MFYGYPEKNSIFADVLICAHKTDKKTDSTKKVTLVKKIQLPFDTCKKSKAFLSNRFLTITLF
jgi:hypothetical protein